MNPRTLLDHVVVWLIAAGTAAALMATVGWLVPVAEVPFPGHGQGFADMIADPFARAGRFPQRPLWPALGWVFAQVGVGAIAFSQICSGALLLVVTWFAWRRTGRYVDALLVTAAVAASGAVLVYQPMPCYSDPLSLLSFVLLVHFAARPRVFWPLVLLSAFSHELVFFFWPWLVYLRCQNGGAWRRELLCLAVVMAIYWAYRAQVSASYGASYYLDNSFWTPWLLPALWSLWAFVTLVEFGPLLLLVSWGLGPGGALSRPDGLGGRFGPLLYLAGTMVLMVLAYDVMRWASFAMLPMVLAACAVVRVRYGRALLLGLLLMAPCSYLWLHPVAQQQGGRHFTEISGAVQELVGPIVVASGGGRVGFVDAVDVSTQLLARFPLVAAVAAASAALLLVAGRLLARRLVRASL